MNAKNKPSTSRRLLLSSILVSATLLLLIIFSSNTLLVIDREKALLEQNTLNWAESLAEISLPYLIANQNNIQQEKDNKNNYDALKTKLNKVVSWPLINYIHIYSSEAERPIQFFTGFKKNGSYPTIPAKIDEIEQLSTIKYHKTFIEVIIKIEKNQTNYGYLYIQSSLHEVSNFVNKVISNAILSYLIALLAFTFLALYIHNKISQPISKITESVQQISQSKDFGEKLASLSIAELDFLAQNINVLLNRVQQSIAVQDELYQQLVAKNINLSNKVTARTDALKESNQELLSTLEKLHQFQSQLVENEKMASLGDMVAGIAHEVNTPIGLGVTAASFMADHLSEVKQAFENKTLKSSQLKKFLTQGQENLGIINRNLERSAKLISSFKKVAVDQSSAELREFNVKELLDEVLLTLRAKINEEQVKVCVECDSNLVVKGKPGPINQILINLIINSIIHGFEQQIGGTINISVMCLSEQLLITYQDDGIGIDKSIKEKIFEPFTTTKRGSGGSGLGLHLVYNLVTQALNGHIDFESTQGKGTTFEITVPITVISQ